MWQVHSILFQNKGINVCPAVPASSYSEHIHPLPGIGEDPAIYVRFSGIPGFTKRYRIYYGYLFLNTDDLHRAEI